MHDKYKKRHQAPAASERVRRQIAVEAARRLIKALGGWPRDGSAPLGDVSEAEFYSVKRRAAAVLGHQVRPGDLPSDAEIRTEAASLARMSADVSALHDDAPEPDEAAEVPALASHLDRFALYRLRLAPLDGVKLSARLHPEGDALYHSLQVFERAREARPYDEEFLLAALLHDVGKAVDPADPAAASVAAVRGAVSERTLWLIENLPEPSGPRGRAPANRSRKPQESSEFLDDLALLRNLDELGRVPGAPVGSIDEALAYLKGLEDEDYLP
jgi:hypothetical protein